MPKCTTFPTTIPTTNHTHKPSSSQKFTLHYIADGKVLCSAEYQLAADALFLELPIPVRHRLMMGMIK